MKYLLLIGTILLSNSIYATQYVRICDSPLYGKGYNYIPGTDICVNPTTGITKYQTVNGTISGQTQLAYRVSQLEKKLAMLMEETEGN